MRAPKEAPPPRKRAATVAEAKTAKVTGGARDAAAGGERGVKAAQLLGGKRDAVRLKERLPGARPPRLSRHKKRAGWFGARVTWPLREAPQAKLALERRRAQRALPSATLGTAWRLAGPVNVGGRCTALVCDPSNPDLLWIGAAGGGVWRSTDGGRTWRLSWRSRTPLEIGALAIDPSHPRTLYCGTGEANLSADSYPGDGVYRSTNGGATWSPWARSATTGLPTRIGAIAVDPFDSSHVLIGGIGFGRMSSGDDFGGLHRTTDGGKTWRRASFVSKNNHWCHAIVFDPVKRGRVFATVTGPGTASGIYRSTDAAGSWTQLTKGLPPTDRIGRTALAIAPSDPDIVYAIAADMASGDADRLLGVFRSANGGDTWANIAGGHFRGEGQMSYNCTIAVHPQKPGHVICGGVDLHMTADAGANWRLATRWDAERGTARYAHADHHAIVMPAAVPGLVYAANDGGLDVSTDGGLTWENRSNGLAVNMFYDIDVAQTDPAFYGGGAQDNGTLVTTTGRADDFWELADGDGGWMVIDPNESGHVYASSQYGSMYRFRNGRRRDVSPPFRDEDSGGIWMVYITIDPTDSDTVYTGNQRVYRTRNDGLSWDALTPVLDGSPISAIEVAVADSQAIYVGTENGGFFRSLDGGATWSANLAGPELPGVMITRIETHPSDAHDVYITVANFGNSHVFHSGDAGSRWSDIDRGKLPDVPHHALLIRPDVPSELYVCCDAGVYMTPDRGVSWRNATGKLPSVMVVDLVYQTATRTLLAATYGRSVWAVKLT
jgi:photosystem II stability/assembly factor-like uncharacterized protein